MSVTGLWLWWRRRQGATPIHDNSTAANADCVILVGSENNSTWGFAHTLHLALVMAGIKVHSAPMNQLQSDYPKARHLLILTATHGDGDAPASATAFLARLGQNPPGPGLPFAVLGFGDRQFPRFCGFAEQVQNALAASGARPLLPLDCIHRQCAQEFQRWGQALGAALGLELDLQHHSQTPPNHDLELVESVAYGAQVQAPTRILRFKTPADGSGQGLPEFQAGDLVGILPPALRSRVSTPWPAAAPTGSWRSACASILVACAQAFSMTCKRERGSRASSSPTRNFAPSRARNR